MHFRLSQLSKAIDTAQQELDKLNIISRAGKDSVLATFGQAGVQPAPLFEDLVGIVAAERPALLVLDAVADVFGGDEMKRPQVRSFINLLRGRLAMPFNCAVVLPAHPSQAGMRSGLGYSGSTHWNNSVRSRYYLTSPKDGGADQRELQLQKNNRGKRGEKVWLRYKDGYFVVDSPGSAMDAASMEKAKTTFLNLLRRYNGRGRRVSDKPGRNYAPTLFAADPDARGVSKQNISTAMTALFAENRLAVAQEGPPSKPRSYLIEAPGG
jgi:RecA-family ATPase